MTNQVLDFLDIDLGLYVNNFESSSLDSSSSSSVNVFSSNPNLTSLTDKEAPTTLPILPLSNSNNINNNMIMNATNHSNLVDAKLNSKSPVNFQPHVHRTHSYSFSSSTSSCNAHAITSSNSTNHSIAPNQFRSSSQLLINNSVAATPSKSKSTNNEATTKKALLKYLDKKTSRKTDSNKQRIEAKLDHHHSHHNHHQVYSSNSIQNANLFGQQMLSNSYSSILTSDQQQTQQTNKPTFSSSSINTSPSSNSSLCSSSSSSAYDYHSQRHNSYSEALIKSQLQQSSLSTSLHLDSSFLTSKFESDSASDKLLVKKHCDANDQPLMDLFTSGTSTTQTHYDDLNNLTTPTDSINQLDYVNTIIPSAAAPPPPQKKQPLLLPKPAPVSNNNNNSHNTNQSFTYTNSATLIIPPVTQSPFITNSQISMMIPTMTNGVISRSNSQPDLTISNLDANFMNDMIVTNYSGFNTAYGSNLNSSQQISCLDPKNRPKVIRRHPSLSYKSSEFNDTDDAFINGFFTSINMENASGGILNGKMSQNNILNGSINGLTYNNTNNTDDGLFLGTDALSDFISNCGTITDLFEDLPDLEDLMSLVTFESSSSSSANALSSSVPANSLAYPHQHQLKQTQCDLNLPNRIPHTTHSTHSTHTASSNLIDCINTNPLSNYYDYCNTESSMINQSECNQDDTTERTTRSAPPSPTPQKKKQRPTGNNIAFNKAWTKMSVEEQSDVAKTLIRIINDEMGLREQLEIIRILNPDVKFKPTDTQFKIDTKTIDDDKFKRIKDVIKAYGLFLNDKLISDNSSDCSANSCPQSYQLAKRELRIKRAQQRLKLKQKKDQRQITKESKSGLFSKTEVIPLSQILPEEDIEVDILS